MVTSFTTYDSWAVRPHKAKAHTQEELSLAFDVVEHLLESVYLLPRRMKGLPNRRSGKTRLASADDEV
jgi:hypothetical protein